MININNGDQSKVSILNREVGIKANLQNTSRNTSLNFPRYNGLNKSSGINRIRLNESFLLNSEINNEDTINDSIKPEEDV